MAFPAGWGRKCAITIQSSQVSGSSHSNFPVLLTPATLPSEMFDADGSFPARSDGGDIRFSSDADGTTQLAREVVEFAIDNDPANGVAEIWVKIPTLSGSSDTTIYVWYNAPTETEPASDSTYGSEAVWSAFTAVYHLGDGTTVGLGDSASGGHTLTNNDSVPAVAAKIRGGTSHTTGVEWLSVADHADFAAGTGSFTFSAWINRDDISNEGRVGNKRGRGGPFSGWQLKAQLNGAGKWRFIDTIVHDGTTLAGWNSVFAGTTDYNTGQWYLAHMVWDGSTVTLYVNGVQDATNTNAAVGDIDNAIPFEIGGSDYLNHSPGAQGNGWPGDIDEVRWIKGATLSSDWMLTEYANQNSPSTFAIEGTPESPSVPVEFELQRARTLLLERRSRIESIESEVSYSSVPVEFELQRSRNALLQRTARINSADAEVSYSIAHVEFELQRAREALLARRAQVDGVEAEVEYSVAPVEFELQRARQALLNRTAVVDGAEVEVTHTETVPATGIEFELQRARAALLRRSAAVDGAEAELTYTETVPATHTTEGQLDQDSYRFRADDGDEAGAGWLEAINTDIEQSAGDPFRVRFLIKETAGLAHSDVTLKLQANRNGTGWFDVTAGSPYIRVIDTQLVDGADTTQQMGAGTFVTPNAGQDDANGRAGGAVVDFGGSDETEMEFGLVVVDGDVSDLDTIQLRLVEV